MNVSAATEPRSSSQRRKGLAVSGNTLGVGIIVFTQLISLTALGSVMGTSVDDEYTLATTGHGPGFAYERAISFEAQPPLYFVLCALWRTLDQSVIFARVPSIIAIVFLTILSARLATLFFRTIHPAAFALAVAVNPFTIYAAELIRPYAFSLALSAAAILAFAHAFYLGDRRPFWLVLFVIVGLVSVFTAYYAALLYAGLFVGLFALPPSRAATIRYIAAASIIAIGSGIALLPLPSQITPYQVGAPLHASEVAQIIEEPWRDFIVPDRGLLDVGVPRLAYLLLSFGLLSALVLELRHINGRVSRLFLTTLVSIDVLYVAIAVVFRVELDPPRHFFALMLVALLTLGAAIDGIWGARRIFAIVIVGSYFFSGLFAVFWEFHTLSADGDWRHVASYVARNARPGDVVYVYYADGVAPFDRVAPTIDARPFPRKPDPNRYDLHDLEIRASADAVADLARIAPKRGHAWLVMNCQHLARHPIPSCTVLSDALGRIFPYASHRDFFGTWVIELGPRTRISDQRPKTKL